MDDNADTDERLIAATLASGLLANASKETTTRAQGHRLRQPWRSTSNVWMHCVMPGKSGPRDNLSWRWAERIHQTLKPYRGTRIFGMATEQQTSSSMPI